MMSFSGMMSELSAWLEEHNIGEQEAVLRAAGFDSVSSLTGAFRDANGLAIQNAVPNLNLPQAGRLATACTGIIGMLTAATISLSTTSVPLSCSLLLSKHSTSSSSTGSTTHVLLRTSTTTHLCTTDDTYYA